MHIFVYDKLAYLILAFICGVLTASFYDVICSLPFVLSKCKKHNFVCDFVFTLICGLIYFIVTYHISNGIFRLFPFAFAAFGFILYRETIGQFVFKIQIFILKKIYHFFNYLISKFINLLDISRKFVKIKVKRLIDVIYLKNKVYYEKIRRRNKSR